MIAAVIEILRAIADEQPEAVPFASLRERFCEITGLGRIDATGLINVALEDAGIERSACYRQEDF